MIRKAKLFLNLLKIKFNKIRRRKKIRDTRASISFDELVQDFRNIGIEDGDIIWVHSSLKSIGYVEDGPKTVINALLKAIGSGTLVIPTFSQGTMYNLCKDENFIFDLMESKTNLGAISSAFLKMKGITRSIHPTHSVSAVGKHAKGLTDSHHIGNLAFGVNSPFGKLVEFNGKILGIGITLKHAPTQYHYIEDIPEKFKFPFRVKTHESYMKKCRLKNGSIIEIEVYPLDPDIQKTRIDKEGSVFIQNYLWEIYEKSGLFSLGKIGEAKSWLINAKEFSEMLIGLAKIGITIYSTERELKSMKLYPYELISDKLKNIEFS